MIKLHRLLERTGRRRGVWLGAVTGLAWIAASSTGWSEPNTATPMNDATKACVDAYGSAQEYRKNNDLLKAREALWKCAAASCPGIIQSDCTTWLSQVVESIPSVVLEAKLGDDNVFDVNVAMDGAQIATQLDGKPIEINPGLHTFTFERTGAPSIEKKVIVAAHSKSQVVLATWPAPAPAMAAAPVTAVTATPSTLGPPLAPSQERSRPVPMVAYVLGGVAVVGLGTFAVLGLTGNATQHDLDTTCSPSCSSSQVSSLKARFIAADVALGIGVASAAGAVIAVLLRPEQVGSASPSRGGLQIPPLAASRVDVVPMGPGPGGAALTWRGSF